MSDVQLTVSQRRALDLQKENLVKAAEQLLEKGQVARLSRNKLGDSQLKNLLAIANETESPAVVTNFVRYQMGRRKDGWEWQGENRIRLGDRLIEAIDNGAVKAAVDAVADLDDVQRQLAKMLMLRHFLGFISRHLTYLRGQHR